MLRLSSDATSSLPSTQHTRLKKCDSNCVRPGSMGSKSIRSTNYILWGGGMELTEYVPREELERRWARIRRLMDCDSLIILQNVDQYYLTGTLQNGVLWFPREGEPLLAVRKSFERAKVESAVKRLVPLKAYSELPELIPNPGETVGFELDVLPVAVYQQVSKYFSKSKIIDSSMVVRNARSIKSPYEIECIRRAAQQLDGMFLDVPT